MLSTDPQDIGAAGGNQVHTLLSDQLAAHGHDAPVYKGGAGAVTNRFSNADTGGSGIVINGKGVVSDTGENEPHPNVQPTQAGNFIIKT
jgi:microcystin-dependent protein